jgi:O-antigen ligase
MRVVHFFIICILALFPFGELLRLSVGNNIVIKPLDIIVGLTSLVYVFLLLRKKANVDKKYLVLLLSFSGIGFFSLLLNNTWLQPRELFASSLYLIRWLCYGMVLLAVLQSDKLFKEKLIKILLFDVISITFIGFVQFILFSSLKPLFAFGWDEHMYRLFSVFLDPNFAGTFFVLFFLFVAGLWYQTKKRWYLVLLAFVFFALLLTFSRAALIMFIVSTAVFCFLMQKKKIFFLLLASIIIFFLAASPFFYVENVNPFRQASSIARIGNYENAIGIVVAKPLLGVGFNSYRYAKTHYGIQSDWSEAPSHADAGADNSFLFVMATTGVVGFTVYLLLWREVLQRTWILSTKKSSIRARVVLSSSIGLFINALFINSLFFPACILWLYLQISLMEE